MRRGRFAIEEAPVEEPGILMTSMIDVIFIILAFFIAVTEIKKGRLEVDVPQVPDAEAASQEEAPAEPIVVEVTAQDEVFVGGTAARDDAHLDRLLERAVRRSGRDAPVYLSGDRQAKNGTMMRVVSRVSRAGLQRIEFAVETGR